MNLLLEIGTEEIPHWMIPSALKQLAAFDLLGAEPQVDATPRRLVLRASGIPERTADQHQVIKGPPVSAGDKAAAGFAKKQGVELSAMEKAGDYYELRKTVPGRLAIDILAESLPDAITGIQWPKTMYWTGGKNGTRFIRPIRWIVALLDAQVIPFEIAGVKSGNVTRGHRQLGATAIPVTIENYESELRKNFVILSSHERRHKIEKEAVALTAKLDTDLLETLTFITEYPTVIRGEFDPAFLELPAEVLTTVMRHHQKYFSVEGPPGLLAPNFVAVMNTSGDPDGLVRHGNERVLKARFNDARFFWDVDQAKKLEERVEDLAKVTFHAKLGSYLDKTRRVEALVKELNGTSNARRAAYLCKADLTTEMVKEFTDLQGIVGGLYAKAQDETEDVGKAIYEHYKPLSMDDSIPETDDGRILALADKLDTLRECFRVGMTPTGSKDPFALRRAAQGVVKILVEAKLPYTLASLMDNDFMRERIQYFFRDVRGFRYDEVNAVLAVNISTLADVEARLTALAPIRATEDFEAIAESFKRVKNIIRQADFQPTGDVVLELLREPAEQNLYSGIERVKAAYTRAMNYRAALLAIAAERPQIEGFFNNILVNAADPAIRHNRLTLLFRLKTEFSTIADFSEIVTSGEQK